MAVTSQKDTMWAGNKRVQRFTVTDEDAVGSPAKDLTGFTAKWALSRFNAAGTEFLTTPVVTKTTGGGGIVITDATNGILEVTLDVADTSALFGTFYFELEVVDGSSNPLVVATGTLTINKNVMN